jgi:CheY-like chemotaxis protein
LEFKNILIIDNEQFILDIFSTCLSEQGYNIQTARTNDEAIGYLNIDTFDLILSDIHMPGMKFSSFLSYLSNLDSYRQCPVIAITGVPELIEKEDRQKIDGIIEKPFLPELLLKTVHKFTSK